MVLGRRHRERFWTALTVRIAFGFMFLIASMNILFLDWDESKTPSENFSKIPANVTTFSDAQAKAYETTWINAKFPYGEKDPQTGAVKESPQIGLVAIKAFLMAMPFILLVLSLLLLTGLFLRPALRLSAIYLVLLGLGKYIVDFKTGVTATTMQDFLYAMFITLALFVLSKEDVPARVEVEEYVHTSK
jgi:uncharacterized membrane protein YphA (DoxX/SURF4 family)